LQARAAPADSGRGLQLATDLSKEGTSPDPPVGREGSVTSISVFNSRAEAEPSGKLALE